jgi:CheY-like chemotaxis protein
VLPATAHPRDTASTARLKGNREGADARGGVLCQRTMILIVEDNEMNRDVLARQLTRRGHAVRTAADGRQGLAVARDLAPDVILLDLGLPDIDGWECARRLKADPATRDIPIIALTAHAMVGDRQKALDAGCDEFDTKPIDLISLLEKVTRLLARTQRPHDGTDERHTAAGG